MQLHQVGPESLLPTCTCQAAGDTSFVGNDSSLAVGLLQPKAAVTEHACGALLAVVMYCREVQALDRSTLSTWTFLSV